MKRRETYKFYIKTKFDRETEEQDISVKVKGDYFEALMFATEAVVGGLMQDLGMNKKQLLETMSKAYDFMKGQFKNGK